MPKSVPTNGIMEPMATITNQKKGSSIPNIKKPINAITPCTMATSGIPKALERKNLQNNFFDEKKMKLAINGFVGKC